MERLFSPEKLGPIKFERVGGHSESFGRFCVKLNFADSYVAITHRYDVRLGNALIKSSD